MKLFEKDNKVRESLEESYDTYSNFVKKNTTYPIDDNLPKMEYPFRLLK
jgi:hypothetical protein